MRSFAGGVLEELASSPNREREGEAPRKEPNSVRAKCLANDSAKADNREREGEAPRKEPNSVRAKRLANDSAKADNREREGEAPRERSPEALRLARSLTLLFHCPAYRRRQRI